MTKLKYGAWVDFEGAPWEKEQDGGGLEQARDERERVWASKAADREEERRQTAKTDETLLAKARCEAEREDRERLEARQQMFTSAAAVVQQLKVGDDIVGAIISPFFCYGCGKRKEVATVLATGLHTASDDRSRPRVIPRIAQPLKHATLRRVFEYVQNPQCQKTQRHNPS